MTTVHTVIRDRRIDVPAPSDLPDGTKVVVSVNAVSEDVGIDESAGDDAPEDIEEWIRRYDALDPLVFTEAELAALEADRQERKAWEKAHFNEHADKLAKQWD